MRIIRVNHCLECPNNKKCWHSRAYDVHGNVRKEAKTLPNECPLEDVQGIIKKIGEPNAADN